MCEDKMIVFPSMEAFEEGVKLPAVHVIFYDYFVKSGVGDAAWKEACLEANDPTDPIVCPQAEAFALILLKNNYFAWLWEAKLALGDTFVTDYDTPEAQKYHFEFSDIVLKCQINLDVEDDIENDADLMNRVLVKHEVNPRKYDSIKKRQETLLKKVRLQASNNEKYRQLKNAMDEKDNAENTAPALRDDEAQRHKKRKVLKGFREYTTAKGTEGKFKGWSSRAANDMKEAIMALKKVEKKDLLFRQVYREIYKEAKGGAKKQKRVQEQEAPDNYEEDMWDLTASAQV